MDPCGQYWSAYQNSTDTNFFTSAGVGMRPLNYLNGAYLSYAGMPGYNYDVPEGTPVLATADGKLYKAVVDPVNGAGYDYYFNSYIDHQNGLFSWYLYAPLTPAILAEMEQPQRVCPGDQGAGHRPRCYRRPALKDHLHFEVRYNGSDNQNVVDPYRYGLWLSNTAHMEGLLMLLLNDDAPTPPAAGY